MSCVTVAVPAVAGVLVSEVPTLSPRQQALLAAAARVVATGGLRGLTHRAVDAEAGLPQGTSSAYMRTRLALLTGLTEYVAAYFAQDIAALAARIEEHADDDGYAVRETGAMLRTWLDSPDLLLVRMELGLEGARQPAIAETFQRQFGPLVDIVEHAIRCAATDRGGPTDRIRVRAVTLIASIDGVLMRAVALPDEERPPFLRDSLELLLTELGGSAPTPPG